MNYKLWDRPLRLSGYVGNNPVNLVDPTGEHPILLLLGGNTAKNVLLGAGTGLVTGLITTAADYAFSPTPGSVQDQFAGIAGQTVGGAVAGLGSSFGPIGGISGGAASGYCSVSVTQTFAENKLSEENLKSKRDFSILSGAGVGAISSFDPTGTIGSVAIPIATGFLGFLTDKLVETFDAVEKKDNAP